MVYGELRDLHAKRVRIFHQSESSADDRALFPHDGVYSPMARAMLGFIQTSKP
jgi:hypothetical protein